MLDERCVNCPVIAECNIAVGYGSVVCVINKMRSGKTKEEVLCEWKIVHDGCFIKNPHTNKLFSNEESMQNVYCNTCGKKIKKVN